MIEKTSTYEYKRRIDLIRHSIYANILSSGDTYKLSFYRIINRICILVQLPICFLIYEDEGNKYVKSDKILTHDDEFFKKLHESESIAKHSYKKTDISIAKNNSSGELFRIFETKYYVMVFYPNHNSIVEPNFINFDSVKSPSAANETISCAKDYIYYCIRDVFSVENTSNHTLSDRISELVEESINAVNRVTHKYKRLKAPKSTEYKIDENKIFSSIYQKHRDSILLSSKIIESKSQPKSKSSIPNIILYYRDYRRIRKNNALRSNKYNHNIKILICDEQKKDWLKSLNQIIKNPLPDASPQSIKLNKNHYLHYVYDVENDCPKVSMETYISAIEAYSLFRNILMGNHIVSVGSESNLTGPDAIIKIIGEYFGDSTVSFADSVFNNKTVYFRKIFEGGGLDRVGFDNESNMLMNDKVRIVAAHYLLSDMVDSEHSSSSKNSLYVMLLPVQVSGTEWGVIGNVVSINVERSYNDKAVWDHIYFLFESVAISIEKELRGSLRSSYIYELINSFSGKKNENESDEEKYPTLGGSVGRMILLEKDSADKVLKDINTDNQELRYVYPFPSIDFSLHPVDSSQKESSNYLPDYSIKIKYNNDKSHFDYDHRVREYIAIGLKYSINNRITVKTRQAISDLKSAGVEVES